MKPDDTIQVLPPLCRWIPIPSIRDERGVLSFAEAHKVIPFSVERVFWIYDVPSHVSRGGHAHWTCSEVVVPICGAFTITLDDGRVRAAVRMDSPDRGVLIPAGVWCELGSFEPGTVLLVMASHPYDATGYVHDYDEYLKRIRIPI